MPKVTAFPKPGVYDVAPMITLLCDNPDAVIHYTLDGSMPTADSPTFDPFLLIPLEQFGDPVPEGKRSYTIRAVAIGDGTASDVYDFRYDIHPRDRDVFISEAVLPGVTLIKDFENNKMYLIKGSERALLVDAGMSTGPLREYVESMADGLPYDVFITHAHPDHVAAMGQFQPDHEVYMHHADLSLARIFAERIGFEYNLDAITHIEEGFIFDLGARQFKVYHIPGHSEGCLLAFDEANGLLISGDAIGSNGPTKVDAVWLHISKGTVVDYLSALQVFRAKVAGKIKHVCGGHGALYLEGETYLDNLEEAAQLLIDLGTEVLVPSPRPVGVDKTVVGDRLTDPNWSSINVKRETCLPAHPDEIASLSNLRIEGVALNEAFKPGILNYTANLPQNTESITIIATCTSRRYMGLTINGTAVESNQPYTITLEELVNLFSIKVTAPDMTTSQVYSVVINRK